ncbi:uncharacterized protein LOC101857628 [Aplysia californica]|uniref:Uncharacterized protein LOC101857628 n=1 Tax=Aplysia californica TaxID=6500 RepID=A0ABM0ZVF5_APLCA|nr:uncharacterized protein LOC101857628 [Aplysia californica]XP_012935303.1 uncharacterized protein LOC101857628 [Aplysia californica]
MRVSAAFLLVFLSALPGFRPGDVTVQAFGPATAGHRYPQHPAGGDDDPLDVASDLDPRFLYTDDLNDPLADLRDVYGQPDYPMGVPEVGAHGDILNGFSLVSGFDVGLNGYHGNVMAAVSCPEKCLCTGTSVDCSGQNLTAVPKGISPLTTGLDLSMNNLQKLPEDTFKEMTSLRELRCVGNNLTRLPKKLFKYNTFLQLL